MWLVWTSLSFPVYYMLASWAITIRFWSGERQQTAARNYEITPDHAISKD